MEYPKFAWTSALISLTIEDLFDPYRMSHWSLKHLGNFNLLKGHILHTYKGFMNYKACQE